MPSSLLFIPDISGFTKFVNNTEAVHGQHIIAELLDLIIASDELGLTVSEVEGDAVFFYGAGSLPSFEELTMQARRTFEAFHTHLKAYETRRICDCGACRTADKLRLKMVAHAGPIELISVRGFNKPYGTDVIVAHRLLKNDVEHDEYMLVTEAALSELGEPTETPDWVELHSGAAEVEDVGSFAYRWLPLDPLLDGLPEPEPPPSFEKSPNPLRRSVFVDRDSHEVFELISNLDLRLSWNRSVDELLFDRGRVNRIGTLHKCVLSGTLIEFETVTSDFGPGRLVYGEYVPDSPVFDDHVNYYIVEPEGTGSRVTFELHYRAKAFPRSLLAPLGRFRFAGLAEKILASIKATAEVSSSLPYPEAAVPSG